MISDHSAAGTRTPHRLEVFWRTELDDAPYFISSRSSVAAHVGFYLMLSCLLLVVLNCVFIVTYVNISHMEIGVASA